MAAEFILIPGRTSRQGTTLNEGKYTDGYREEVSTLLMHPDDLAQIGAEAGDRLRVWNEFGDVTVTCGLDKGECPPGIVFISYGDISSRLMGGETHGSGMPTSKGLDVRIEKAEAPGAAEPAEPIE